jgi:phosphopantetheinyl transferase (holo-ACP synthase)
VLWAVKEAVLKAAHATCSALRDVELSWRDARRVDARVLGDDSGRAIVVRHRAVGPYTIAVALCR